MYKFDIVSELCSEIEPSFDTAKVQLSAISSLVPRNSYYKYVRQCTCIGQSRIYRYVRYNDHWRFAVQRISFLCSFHHFLRSGDLMTHEKVSEMLGGP